MQPYTPYPQPRVPFSASSQPNLYSNSKQTAEPHSNAQQQKSYLFHKVQALLPYLADVLKQNDNRSHGIVGKLSGLRDNLDGIFEEMEK